ncbi:MAG: hypothetical protein AB7K24_13025 [Gemmataceae bacterium]
MPRNKFVSLLLVFALLFGMVSVTLADEGTVVSFAKGKLTVKIGDKDEDVPLKGVKIVDAGGTAIKGKDLTKALKKGAKVDVKKEGGKVTEIVVK